LTATAPEKAGKYKAAQTIVLVISILLFIVMNIFPPWNAVVNPPANNETVFVGYRFISDPPHSPFGYGSIIIVNYTRLLVQWGALILFALTLYLFLGYRDVKDDSAQGNGAG
jgi:hypothetical protein